jgi:hypothetical protein
MIFLRPIVWIVVEISLFVKNFKCGLDPNSGAFTPPETGAKASLAFGLCPCLWQSKNSVGASNENVMSSFTQEASLRRHNPFQIKPKNSLPQSSSGTSRVAANTGKPVGQVYARPVTPLGLVSSPSLESKRAHDRAVRRRQFLKKRQTQWLAWVRRSVKLVAVLVLVFALMPSPVQKKVYHSILPWTNQAPQLSEPPLPLAYDYISSPFGKRWGKPHQGIDFAAAVGEPIYASAAGTVVHSGWEAGYGKSIVLDHGKGMETRYGHCSRLLVKEGSVVPKGTLIARVGSTGHSTGPHLHFEVIVNGVRKNPAFYYTFANNNTTHLASAED